MIVDVRPTQLIHVPRSVVAAYMFDPANDLNWTGGITASRPDKPGPLTLGATVERDARFIGRTFTYGYQVTAAEPGRSLELSVERPFPMIVRYELEDLDENTLVAIHATGTPGGFFGWVTPLMNRRVRKQIAADLRRLRDRLEI
jgi:hypothetical protein